MFGLAILFGCGVGFALGLTGGGGGVFAVPLLVYGLDVPPREAVGISLASVGGMAVSGVVPRLIRGEVELRTGSLFALAGMLGAPVGSHLSTLAPESALLAMFGVLMLIVAWRMWAQTRSPQAATENGETDCAAERLHKQDRSACQRNEDGTLRLTSKCARLLTLAGLLTGVLSGMFGVGGGFIIVPALVLFGKMEIHRAVGTSLLAISLISLSGVASHLVAGRELAVETALQFVAGGLAGVWLGGIVATRLKGPTLQKSFATAVVLVAVFVIAKSVVL